MRTTMTLVTLLIFALYAKPVQAEAIDIVASAHGSTCDEAKTTLIDIINNGSAVYTTEQSHTHQFPTGAAATKFCEDSGASAPFATIPDINDVDYFPLPTETRVAGSKCSTSVSDGNVTYGIGWQGSAACNN